MERSGQRQTQKPGPQTIAKRKRSGQRQTQKPGPQTIAQRERSGQRQTQKLGPQTIDINSVFYQILFVEKTEIACVFWEYTLTDK